MTEFAPTPEGWVGPRWPVPRGEQPHEHEIYVTGDFETGNRYARCKVPGCKHKVPLTDRTRMGW